MKSPSKFSVYIRFKRFLETSTETEYVSFRYNIFLELNNLWERIDAVNTGFIDDINDHESEEIFRHHVNDVIRNYRGEMNVWSDSLTFIFNSGTTSAQEFYKLIPKFLPSNF